MTERERAQALEICSYRTVFELERRIYRVDRVRLNPQGVPVRGVVYALILVLAGAIGTRLPGVALVAHAVPWFLRELALPVLLGGVAATMRIDGRPFHLAALALARLAVTQRHRSGLRPVRWPGGVWRPADLVMLPDGSDPGIRRLRFQGPGALVAVVAHERTVRQRSLFGRLIRRADLTLSAPAGAGPRERAAIVELALGARVETRRQRR